MARGHGGAAAGQYRAGPARGAAGVVQAGRAGARAGVLVAVRPGEAARLPGAARATRLSSAGTAAGPTRAAEMTWGAGVIGSASLTGTAGLTRPAGLTVTAGLTGTAGLTRAAGLSGTAGLVRGAGQAAGQAGAGETASWAARCRAARSDRQPARFGRAHRAAGVATRTGRGVRLLTRRAAAGCGTTRAANDTSAALAALDRAREGSGTARLARTGRLPGGAGEAARLLVGRDTAAR
ncbi:hypothetical protein ACQP2Y_33870 [Actinoplanes sp. CA-051413]|uniref:hypothetical protein n=1 Tax=Actinoplanes sp. CA-051413 TaxID=3239899 RepID=UPI003D98E830